MRLATDGEAEPDRSVSRKSFGRYNRRIACGRAPACASCAVKHYIKSNGKIASSTMYASVFPLDLCRTYYTKAATVSLSIYFFIVLYFVLAYASNINN